MPCLIHSYLLHFIVDSMSSELTSKDVQNIQQLRVDFESGFSISKITRQGTTESIQYRSLQSKTQTSRQQNDCNSKAITYFGGT